MSKIIPSSDNASRPWPTTSSVRPFHELRPACAQTQIRANPRGIRKFDAVGRIRMQRLGRVRTNVRHGLAAKR